MSKIANLMPHDVRGIFSSKGELSGMTQATASTRV